jgi:hypothetical protein
MTPGKRRFWPLVFLDGWRAEIEEDPANGVLSVTVIGETGRAWHTTRETIFEAIDAAHHILTAERTSAMIINPALDYLDYESA